VNIDRHAELRRKLRPGGGDLVRFAEPIENDSGTGRGKRAGDTQPDTARRSGGYQRYFAFERACGNNVALRHGNAHGRKASPLARPEDECAGTRTLPTWSNDFEMPTG